MYNVHGDTTHHPLPRVNQTVEKDHLIFIVLINVKRHQFALFVGRAIHLHINVVVLVC